MNFNGWGPFSEVAYITAAGVPQRPGAPIYTSSTATHLVVEISPTLDDSGAPITAYELFLDEITAAPAIVFSSDTLASSDLTMTRSIEYAPTPGSDAAAIAAWQAAMAGTISANLVAGGRYRLVSRSVNSFGTSEASEELRVALGRLPD
jgi:hypothetical protein